MKKLAVYPGSFDPVTLGHADIARRIARIFGSCRVVVMNNREKEYLFSLEERFRLCQAAFQGEENISVDFYEGIWGAWKIRSWSKAFGTRMIFAMKSGWRNSI